MDKAAVDPVSLSAHKRQCNKRSSERTPIQQCPRPAPTIHHAYALYGALTYRHSWKLRSIWMCRCKHMLNWIEIEFAILCAAANAIFFAVREAPAQLLVLLLIPLPLAPCVSEHSSYCVAFIVFLFYLPLGGSLLACIWTWYEKSYLNFFVANFQIDMDMWSVA